MAQTPPSKAPTGPKVSGTRTVVSLIFLVIVLVVCGIELRAGLGQFLTLRAFNNAEVSENSLFKNKSFAEAQGMVAAFPSKSEVQTGAHEDLHHFYWYSLLRPLMGEKSPEVFVSSDHSTPPKAVSFYTSTEGELESTPVDPNAVPESSPMSSGMGGPPGMGGRPGGGGKGGGGKGSGGRPPLEDEATNPPAADAPKTEGESGAAPTDAAPTDAAPTDAAPTDAAPTEPDPTTEPAREDDKPETPATPN